MRRFKISIISALTIVLCLVSSAKLLYSYASTKTTSNYIFDFSNKKLLTDRNICSLDEELLELSRNEILARHGYSFEEKRFDKYFRQKKWYKVNRQQSSIKINPIEKKNIEIIDNYIYKINNNNESIYRVIYNKSAQFDLNGDGKLDDIKIVNHYNNNGYELLINGKSMWKSEELMCNEISFRITDVNLSDNLKEIQVRETDMKSIRACDYSTFYSYKNGIISDIGNVEYYSKQNYYGSISGEKKINVLFQWFANMDYRLNAANKILPAKCEFFATNQEYELTLCKELTLYEKNNADRILKKLSTGDKIKILGVDDKNWMLVSTSDGKKGWFKVDNLNVIHETGLKADEMFSGIPVPVP